MDGVVVASDITQEWLLPWWWDKYRKHNDFEVLFVDLGLSFEMKDWCKERGLYVRLRMVDDFVKERVEVDPVLVAEWEKMSKMFWSSRAPWFKKPFACLETPFDRSLWIDLDCEVRGDLAPLFEYADVFPHVSMAKEFEGPYFNSGVISYRKESLLLKEWAKACVEKTHLFRGDQEVFTSLVKESQIHKIPLLYNWSRILEENQDAVILHWHGGFGKLVIQSQLSS